MPPATSIETTIPRPRVLWLMNTLYAIRLAQGWLNYTFRDRLRRKPKLLVPSLAYVLLSEQPQILNRSRGNQPDVQIRQSNRT